MVNRRSLSLREEAIFSPRVEKRSSSLNANKSGSSVADFQRHGLFPILFTPGNFPEPRDTEDSLSKIKETHGGNEAKGKDGTGE